MDSIWGDDFIKTYLTLANKASIKNEEIHLGGMFVLLGQAMIGQIIPILNQEIDNRIHCLVIQKSGSGKGPAFKFMEKIAELAGMSMTIRSSVTSAGLIGTIAPNGDVIPGDAFYYNIIAFEEARTIFRASQMLHSCDLIENINQILDPAGVIEKRMAHGVISYRSTTSLFGSTYPIKSEPVYIDSGFLPRMLVLYRDIDSKFYYDVLDWVFCNIGKRVSFKEEKMKLLANTLREIRNMPEFDFEFTARRCYKNITKLLKDISSEYDEAVVSRAEPFISRIGINAVKMSTCMAVLYEKRNVSVEDIERISTLVEYSWRGILNYIRDFDVDVGIDPKLEKIIKAIVKLADVGDTIQFRELLRFVKMKKNELLQYLYTLEDAGFVKVKSVIRSGRQTYDVVRLR